MRGFLIFLAFAFPVVLASPFFWSLVRMEWGAERIGYVHKTPAGQVTQWATLGPKAQWPDWVLIPEGSKLTIRANFETARGFNASGFGDIWGKQSGRQVTERYRQALERAGWTVQVGRFDASTPDIPPKPLHWCIVQARRQSRVLQMSVDIDDPATVGRMHWSDGPMPFPANGAKEEPCWPA